jgi:hypothetical protein
MPIPKNIKREHIFQAMIKIKVEGVPNMKKAKSFHVKYENELWPCKLLVSWGNLYANGEELDPNPTNFQTNMAIKYLKELGFEIIPVDK